MSFISDIQQRFNKGTIVEKLIYINIFLFILTLLFQTTSKLHQGNHNFIIQWFSLHSDYEHLFVAPWSIVSYGFLHANFPHILLNLIALYFIGNLFIQYFTQRQLLTFYLLGTFFGGVLFLLGYNYFPLFKNQIVPLVGASAGISAIFVGIATYMPNFQFKVRFIGFVKLWYLAAIWVFFDVIQLSGNNAGGHFAHLGGAIFGFLYVHQASNKKIDLFQLLSNLFKIKRKPLKTVYKSKKKTQPTSKSTKADYQKKVDAILEKISKSGYDTLTPEEKTFLFKQGKK
ncbi:MAG: rhomboid family intramembrane serine protease [Flavobacteriaceae bacterium]